MHYILFDLETTCWSTDYPKREREIIEIGAVILDRFGNEIDRYERLVRPQKHPYLSSYCVQLTGIEQSDVDQGASFHVLYKEFNSWLDQVHDDMIFVAWGKYDEPILNAACHEFQLEALIHNNYLDAKKAYHVLRRLDYRIGLAKAMKAEGLEFEGNMHRALPDTLNLVRLFRKHIGEWPT